MDDIKLPPRLALLAAMVPEGSRLADVGTDHGLLPLSLLMSGKIKYAVATDIRPGPLSRARSNAAEHSVDSMRFCLCDGLEDVDPHEADVVTVAGMGGENIAQILRNAPWTRENTLVLLQPMSKGELLRAFLSEMGFAVTAERLVEDNGRIYSVIAARGGKPLKYNAAEYYTGRYEQVSTAPLFAPFLDELTAKLNTALSGISRSSKPGDEERREHLQQVLRELGEMREKNAEGK